MVNEVSLIGVWPFGSLIYKKLLVWSSEAKKGMEMSSVEGCLSRSLSAYKVIEVQKS